VAKKLDYILSKTDVDRKTPALSEEAAGALKVFFASAREPVLLNRKNQLIMWLTAIEHFDLVIGVFLLN
jgi:hypothetical protein